MDYALTLSDIGLIAIGLALLVLILYCIALVRNLIPAVKTLNSILEDVENISATAASGVTEAQKIVSDIGVSIAAVSGSLKGKDSALQNLTTLVKSVSSAIGLVRGKKS